MHNHVYKTHTHTRTIICYTGGVTEAAAMAEGLNRGVLITEGLHISMLPPWKKGRQMNISRKKYNPA